MVFSGTAQTDIPVAALLRSWGPTDEVFVAYERRLGIDEYAEHELWLKPYECSDNDGCASPLLPAAELIADGVLYDQFMNPSMGVNAYDANPLRLHFALREKLEDDCDPSDGDYADVAPSSVEATALDLAEREWSDGWAAPVRYTIEEGAPNACIDAGASYTRALEGDPYACWRLRPTSGTDEVHCGARTGFAWSSPDVLDNRDDVQDHPWFDFDGADRVVAHHDEPSAHEIRVRYPDSATSPEPDVAFPESVVAATNVDYPAIEVASNGRTHLAWHETNGASSIIRYTSCADSADCEDEAQWDAVESVVTGKGLRNVHIATDGKKVFLTYMKDDGVLDTRYRVYLTTKCVTGAWATPQLIRTPTNATDSQSLYSGRPALGLNRVENIAHLTFVEINAFAPTGIDGEVLPADGDVWWFHHSYSDCP